MSGRGEQPESDEGEPIDMTELAFGQVLYDGDGNAVGPIRGLEAGGAFVSVRDGIEALSIEHSRSGHDFGEAELMWRCTTCGEMGEIDEGLPETCPNCGDEREALMYWTED